MSFYPNKVYIDQAIKRNLIKSESEVATFVLGHMTGVDAIRAYFMNPIYMIAQRSPKELKNHTESYIAKLLSGFYDGQNITQIFNAEKITFAECFLIFQELWNTNERVRIFTNERTHCLPRYVHTNSYDSRDMAVYRDLVCSHQHTDYSRSTLIGLFIKNNLPVKDIEKVFSYLVHNRFL